MQDLGDQSFPEIEGHGDAHEHALDVDESHDEAMLFDIDEEEDDDEECTPSTQTSLSSLSSRSASVKLISFEDEPTSKVHYGSQMREFDRRSRGLGDEKCVLVGVQLKSHHGKPRLFSLEQSLDELGALADTAGMKVVGQVTQALEAPYAATYIGTGKVNEVISLLEGSGAKTVVFDDELSPGQQRNLEKCFGGEKKGIKVVDRTALILDIFAQHAQTKEGKLQVELALYQYRLPRLTRMWTHLERQSGFGGVGLRGPGETQLEVDRRLIQDKIASLKTQINAVKEHRGRQRSARKKLGVPIVSVVGYTNAGKSSFVNSLTSAELLAEDMLFATLDTKTTLAELPGMALQPRILLTDTVGFIQKLPTNLVAAFRSTLEEVLEADCLLHIVDASTESYRAQIETVNKILDELGASDKPQVLVYNKIDKLTPEQRAELKLEAETNNVPSVLISARTKEGVADCLVTLLDSLRDVMVNVEVLIPFANAALVNEVHERGVVESEDYRSTGSLMVASVPRDLLYRLQPYRLDAASDEESEVEDQEQDEEYWKRLAKKRSPLRA